MSSGVLSERGLSWAKLSEHLLIWKILKDLWDPETNPSGYVSLGVAENALMHSELLSYFNEKVKFPPSCLTYGDGPTGSHRLKTALGQFLTRTLNCNIPIQAEDICITNGVSASTEHLSSVLTDRGDVFLLGRPYYKAFIEDIALRTGVELVTVPFGLRDPFSADAVTIFKNAIESCLANGRRVSGIMICNPHSPLGQCYSAECLVGLMKLCQRYRIHLVSDEIYALSTFSLPTDHQTTTPFTSLFALATDELIDSSLIHLLYGFSKDFGASGIRLGCIVTRNNPAVQKALIPIAKYAYASLLTDAAVIAFLEDATFVDWYLKENRRRLSINYQVVSEWATKHGIRYGTTVRAALFFWVQLGEVYQQKLIREGKISIDDEQLDAELNKALLEQKLFLATGASFGSEQAGWFRLTFSQERKILVEGLRRIETVLDLKAVKS